MTQRVRCVSLVIRAALWGVTPAEAGAYEPKRMGEGGAAEPCSSPPAFMGPGFRRDDSGWGAPAFMGPGFRRDDSGWGAAAFMGPGFRRDESCGTID